MLSSSDRILPGDLIFFSRSGLINKAISWKTWSEYTHVEVYLGHAVCKEICERVGREYVGECMFASRNPERISWRLKPIGGGVDLWVLDPRGKALVRRPRQFDMQKAIEWLSEPGILGQPYDVVGLFNFYSARRRGRDNGAMFCSEAAARLLKKTGSLAGENFDSDTTSPSMLAFTDAMRNVAKFDPKTGRRIA